MSWLIKKSNLKGTIIVPPSKSLTLRAIIVASLSKGESIINNYLECDDSEAVISSLILAGIKIIKKDSTLIVIGNTFKNNNEVFNVRSSATALRFLIPIFLTKFKEFKITGNEDLMERPFDAFAELFLANDITYSFNDNVYHIKGSITPGQYEVDGTVSSQFASGLALALSTFSEPSILIIKNRLVSKPYFEMTLKMINHFSNNQIKMVGNLVTILEGDNYFNNSYDVEGDYSQAAFFLVLAALGFKIKLKGLNNSSWQGDFKIIEFLENLGATFKFEDDYLVLDKVNLKPNTLDLIDHPDLFLPLAVFASFIDGKTKFINITNLKYKESNRLKSLVTNFDNLKIRYQIAEDWITIKGSKPVGNILINGYNDHRVIMAFTVLGLANKKTYIIKNTEQIIKTYPEFFNDLIKLGGNIQMKKIDDIRKDIIDIDKQMIELFKLRAESVLLISNAKKELKLPIVDKEYEKIQIEKHLELLGDKSIENQYKEFYSKILDISYSLQEGVPKMALIGKGVSHSLSPKLHYIISSLAEFPYSYGLIEVEDEKELYEMLQKIKNHEYKAFNITMPYKKTVINYLDMLTHKAHASGTVNLVYMKNGMLIGDNCDYDGIVYSLSQMNVNLNRFPIYILGTGATARTAASVFDTLKLEYTFVSRTANKTRDLSPVISYEDLKQKDNYIIINTTPVGMYPHGDEMPIGLEEVRKAQYVFDVIYNPNPTNIVKYAKDGMVGLDMLVAQGIATFNQVFEKDLKIDKKIVEAIKEGLDE